MNSHPIDDIKSILILDDDDSLESLELLIRENLNVNVITTTLPTEAEILAEKMFFDIILIDVTLPYNGYKWGGLEVYKNLIPRYGESSLIVYSQVFEDRLLKQYNYNFNFVKKAFDPVKFIGKLINKMNSLRKRQTIFIAMPFKPEYDDLYESIKKSIEKSNYKPIRLDDTVFNKSIYNKLFDEIEKSKIVIFFSTDRSPNVFYECGYAVALGKEVVTLIDFHKNLPFDVRDRNAISYDNSPQKLESKLFEKLINLTNVEP